LESVSGVVANWKLECRSVVFAVARTINAGRHCTQLSVVNVSFQSSLKRGLVEGFTSCALRNGKPGCLLVHIGWLLWSIVEDTKRWVFAQVAPKRLSKRIFVESTIGWRRRDLIEREAREQGRGLWGRVT